MLQRFSTKMPPKKKSGGLGRKTANTKLKEKSRKNPEKAEIERKKARARWAARQVDERAKELRRLYDESRRSKNQGRDRQKELFLQRQAYMNAKTEKVELQAEFVKENLARMREYSIAYANGEDPELWDHPLMEAGRLFHESLDIGEVKRCVVCLEKYPFIDIGPKNNKCKRCTRSQVFAKSNNLTPEEAPQCLKDLNQVELAAIRQNCPVMYIFTKGSSKATRGHCLCVTQDVKSFATELPHKPPDLPYLLLRNPKESAKDDYFKVSRSKIIKALKWLQKNNPK